MSSSEKLIKATLRALTSRLSTGIASSSSLMNAKAKEIPELIRKELEVLQNEIQNEVVRIDNNTEEKFDDVAREEGGDNAKIKQLRNAVRKITEKIEKINS